MRIENYLGFPSGIWDTTRAFSQAEKFGAQIIIAKGATTAGRLVSRRCCWRRLPVSRSEEARHQRWK